MASPQHSPSSDAGSTSSAYPAPHLSTGSSVSGYSWLLDRLPRLSPYPPASLDDSASHYPSSSWPYEIQVPGGSQEYAAEMPPSPHLPASLHDSASPYPSTLGSPEIPLPAWLQESAPGEIPPSPPAGWQGLIHPLPYPSSSGSSATTETYSSSDKFTPSHDPGGSVSSHYSSASYGSVSSNDLISVPSHHSMSEGLVPSQHLASDGSPPSPSPPTETSPDNAEFFNKNMKKIGIVAGVAIVGGTIAGILGSQIKHNKHRDYQDS
ncbi:hypothetical protein BGY98DRAFT_217171 [Russula aff. rugulosa BPL654]|nr:hypothetical protein BGY98DRAFT_217171 [Russula aff. rugulosa BPL654]